MIINSGTRKPTLNEIQRLNGSWRKHLRYRGCVGHWMMVEGGGTVVYDISGFAKHTTSFSVTPPSWTQGIYGTQLDFAGNALVELPAITEFLSNLDVFSIAAWLRIDTAAALRVIWGVNNGNGFGDTATVFEFNVGRSAGVGEFCAAPSPTATRVTVAISVGLQHWVGTKNGGDIEFFINGKSVGTAASAPAGVATGSTHKFGCDDDQTRFFDGAIIDARIYARILTAQEIQSLYYDPFLEFRKLRRYYFFPSAKILRHPGMSGGFQDMTGGLNA